MGMLFHSMECEWKGGKKVRDRETTVFDSLRMHQRDARLLPSK